MSAEEKKSGGIPGVAPALASKLEKLGLRSDDDLILHLPLRYEDETRITAACDAPPGVAAQFEVEVVSCEIAYRPRRQLVCRARDESGELILRFLNFYPSQQKVLQPDARLRVFGETRGGFFGTELVHPRFRVIRQGEPLPQALTPVYPATAGVGQATLRKLIAAALARAELADTLPDALRHKHKLDEFSASVQLLHNPPPLRAMESIEAHVEPAAGPPQGGQSTKHGGRKSGRTPITPFHGKGDGGMAIQAAWRRIRFDELLAQQLSLRRAHAARQARGAPVLRGNGALARRLLKSLPFSLTPAQQRVWCEIAADLAQPHPMQRLLQGDVGSGKTIVAALAMLQAAENGYQAALMAPTEILAEQHYRKLAGWLAPLDIGIAWMTSSLKKKDKAAMAQRIAGGDALIVVGTHALIEDEVSFHRLGLAIVDEQHRFGVRQRLALKHKADSPHQLTMSATPIPRTLAMSYYADLDVSSIDELPPGRAPVLTKLVSEARRGEVTGRVRDICRAGGQVYWVCPLIEESQENAGAPPSFLDPLGGAGAKRQLRGRSMALQLKTAEETFARLTRDLPDLRIGLVHGRMKGEDKAGVMDAFARNEIQVLVATTVIEVGVDVPNASLMVIEHAERFGLAQLHQLRGRVGRGSAESACVLLYAQPLSQNARQRLKIIFEHGDGFEIARRDLELRGPGEFIGARQSGMPLMRYADLDDTALLEAARGGAETLLRDHPDHALRHLRRWLGGREQLLKA